ncbi:hypothetical protein [Tahibacter amnicola]|uniref:DUF2244 domain-containing protein n=1 Tax=Tahibacter amnicola TaxID=2976241 RepID=A0ABY6BJD1_9GAMM|nr:hypothetical protein [Tahibacter amnicola]UXI70129.1 hypothetical protein N4264_11010 [Tahibacter amnicola]
MDTNGADAPPRSEFRNDKAVFVWGFVATWLAFLLCFTYLFVRERGIPQVGAWGLPILLLFWIAGIGIAVWACAFARICVRVSASGVVVRERFPSRTRELRCHAADLSPPRIAAGRDSEGDPYFQCVLTLPDGREIVMAEGPDHSAVERVRTAYLAAIAGLRPRDR